MTSPFCRRPPMVSASASWNDGSFSVVARLYVEVFCFFAGLTHCSIFTMSISRFRPCRVKTTMPARAVGPQPGLHVKVRRRSAPFGHSTRPFVRNHLSSSSSSIAPFVQGWSFPLQGREEAPARFASSALSRHVRRSGGRWLFVPEAGAAAGAGAEPAAWRPTRRAAAAGRFVPEAGAGAGGSRPLAAGAARGEVVAAGRRAATR